MARPVIDVHFRVFDEDGLWVGECVDLGVATSAETKEAAQKGILEATELYLRTLGEHGELRRILEERGIRVRDVEDGPVVQMEERTLELPIGVE